MPNLPIAGEYASDRELLELARSALDAAASAIGNSMCFHENTHRGGYLWTICDDCGAKWADDRGGFQKPVMPKAFGQALQAIAAIDRAIGKAMRAELASVIESSLSSGVKGEQR